MLSAKTLLKRASVTIFVIVSTTGMANGLVANTNLLVDKGLLSFSPEYIVNHLCDLQIKETDEYVSLHQNANLNTDWQNWLEKVDLEFTRLMNLVPELKGHETEVKIWGDPSELGSTENTWSPWMLTIYDLIRHELAHQAVHAVIKTYRGQIQKDFSTKLTGIPYKYVWVGVGPFLEETLADAYALSFDEKAGVYGRTPEINYIFNDKNLSKGAQYRTQALYENQKISCKTQKVQEYIDLESTGGYDDSGMPDPHGVSKPINSMLYDFSLKSGDKEIFTKFFLYSLSAVKEKTSYRIIVEEDGRGVEAPHIEIVLDLDKVLLKFEKTLPENQQTEFASVRTHYGLSTENIDRVWSVFLSDDYFGSLTRSYQLN